MTKVCSHCGTHNDDEFIFCGACGEPLEKDLKIIMELDNYLEEQKKHPNDHRTTASIDRGDEHDRNCTQKGDEFESRIRYQEPEKKSSALPLIIVGIVVVVAVVVFLL